MRSLAQVLVLASFSVAVHAESPAAHIYRYEILTHTGDTEYRNEVSTMPKYGPAYLVERDTAGRLISEADYQDGILQGSGRLHYNGSDALSDGFEEWNGTQLISRSKWTRNKEGVIVREDRFTASGQLTEYFTAQVYPDHIVLNQFDAAGVPRQKIVQYFGASGALTRRLTYASADSDNSFIDIEMDENTGHRLRSKAVLLGKIKTTQSWTYSPDGDLTRLDAYLENDHWYATTEFEHNRMARKTIAVIGGTKEDTYFYDQNDWLARAEIRFNNQLVATVAYERATDGTPLKSTARYADGSLLAVYPPPLVTDVDRHGQVLERTDGTIYGKRDLW